MTNDSYFRYNDNDNKTTMSTNNFKTIKKEIDNMKTHISIDFIIDNWENGLNLRHTLQ